MDQIVRLNLECLQLADFLGGHGLFQNHVKRRGTRATVTRRLKGSAATYTEQ
jgi:hypothetical protein